MEPLFRKALQQASYATSRGHGEPAGGVYVDADDMAGALRVNGKYTVHGGSVAVTLRLSRDGQIVSSITVEGKKGDPAALAEELVRDVNTAAERVGGE